MDMARIQPAEAGPTPSAGDLEAYDAILGSASRLTPPAVPVRGAAGVPVRIC